MQQFTLTIDEGSDMSSSIHLMNGGKSGTERGPSDWQSSVKQRRVAAFTAWFSSEFKNLLSDNFLQAWKQDFKVLARFL